MLDILHAVNHDAPEHDGQLARDAFVGHQSAAADLERLAQREQVFGTPDAAQRLAHPIGLVLADLCIAQLQQPLRVAFALDDGAHHLHATDAAQVADHVVQLDVQRDLPAPRRGLVEVHVRGGVRRHRQHGAAELDTSDGIANRRPDRLIVGCKADGVQSATDRLPRTRAWSMVYPVNRYIGGPATVGDDDRPSLGGSHGLADILIEIPARDGGDCHGDLLDACGQTGDSA
ncbi:MAG: hypothetical protein IH627_06590 [Rubrivivax sp.]|nr:hypothetical protein [Rubrivivax sp.]